MHQNKKEKKHFSYDKSESDWEAKSLDEEFIGDALKGLSLKSLDSWRHQRMRSPLIPIVQHDVDSSWLTVGDGRFGSDAHFLQSQGATCVHASDISDALLKISHSKGVISSYSMQNAENIQFDDSSFDYVYCKEALHHFPRPHLALHEMFRVCRKGVIITEPRDHSIDRAPFSSVLNMAKSLMKRDITHKFEPIGNYIYSISERELEKFLLGMGYNKIAFTGCNDAYFPFVGATPLHDLSFTDRVNTIKLKSIIFLNDAFKLLGIKKTKILTSILYKNGPTPELENKMKAFGWTFKALPTNPYATDAPHS